MPHIIVEYSKPLETLLNTQDLMKAGIQILLESNQFTPPAIKARSISFSEFVLPQDYEHFIHVTILILEGRSAEVRSKITQDIFDTFKQRCPIQKLSLSVDLQEMDSICYRK